MVQLLAIDTTAIIISAIGAIVSLGTVAMTLLIKKRVEGYHKEVDGKMTKLLEVTGQAKKAEGKEEGMQQQKDEGATVADDVVEKIKSDPDINITKF